MNKTDFKTLFDNALTTAAAQAEKVFKTTIPRTFLIEMHASGLNGVILPAEEVFEVLYISDNDFPVQVDVAVKEIDTDTNTTIVFMRANDRKRVKFEATAQFAAGTGPFKQLLSPKLKLTRNIPLPADYESLLKS